MLCFIVPDVMNTTLTSSSLPLCCSDMVVSFSYSGKGFAMSIGARLQVEYSMNRHNSWQGVVKERINQLRAAIEVDDSLEEDCDAYGWSLLNDPFADRSKKNEVKKLVESCAQYTAYKQVIEKKTNDVIDMAYKGKFILDEDDDDDEVDTDTEKIVATGWKSEYMSSTMQQDIIDWLETIDPVLEKNEAYEKGIERFVEEVKGPVVPTVEDQATDAELKAKCRKDPFLKFQVAEISVKEGGPGKPYRHMQAVAGFEVTGGLPYAKSGERRGVSIRSDFFIGHARTENGFPVPGNLALYFPQVTGGKGTVGFSFHFALGISLIKIGTEAPYFKFLPKTYADAPYAGEYGYDFI
jgi:hypothetical protein